MAMQDWIHKYPRVQALLQGEGDMLEGASVEDAVCAPPRVHTSQTEGVPGPWPDVVSPPSPPAEIGVDPGGQDITVHTTYTPASGATLRLEADGVPLTTRDTQAGPMPWPTQPQRFVTMDSLTIQVCRMRQYWRAHAQADAFWLYLSAPLYALLNDLTSGILTAQLGNSIFGASAEPVAWLPDGHWALHWSQGAGPQRYCIDYVPLCYPWRHRVPTRMLLSVEETPPCAPTPHICETPHGAPICRCGAYLLEWR